MTDQSLTIPTAPLPDPGMDYLVLRTEAMRLVQAMSGTIWTDYNFSDPGVTIVEQVCYALTELSYRADSPVADLLCDPATSRVRLARAGLYPARAIMPVNPVTIDDIRRLLIDRVEGVANCWVEKVPPDQARGVNGLYRISLLVSQQDPCCRVAYYKPEDVREKAREVYCAHRALCEDHEHVHVLKLLATKVHAKVQLDEGAESATVLADLMFRIGMLFAPEPKRHSLDQLLAQGQTTADIFNGPLLHHGFIDDDELAPYPGTIAVNDILQVMAATPGVVAARDLTVRVEGNSHAYVPDETITVPKGCILWLDTTFEEGRHGIQLYRGAVLCKPDPDKVTRLLDALWAEQRRTYPLAVDYAEQYGAPTGQPQDWRAYTSVQEQFPNVYGINSFGLPPYASTPRRAQARQLKGYLMAFDQLMADYFAQLGFIRDLFSIRAGRDRTYVSQSLRPIVPDVTPLLSEGYREGLHEIVAAYDPVQARQSAIIDLLLSLYAERLSLPPEAGCDCSGQDETSKALLRAKQILLARTVPVTRERGRGFDYLRLPRRSNIAGMEIKCRIELGLADAVAATSERDGAQIVQDADEASFGHLLPPEQARIVEATFLPIGDISDALGEADDPGPSPLAGERVADALQPALGAVDNYRIGIMPGETRVDVVCRDDADSWWLIGRYDGTAEAIAAVAQLVRTADHSMHRHQLYLVEHILMRYAQPRDSDDGRYYSLRMTAVVAMHREEASNDTWRRQVRAIVRQNSPAHVAVDVLFLRRERFRDFLDHYRHWRHALLHGTGQQRAMRSRQLERFLRHQHEHERDDSAAAEG